MRFASLMFGLAFAGVLACSSDPPGEEEEPVSEDELVGDQTTPDARPEVLVKDPRVLTALEERFSLGSFLGAREKSGAAMHAASAAYRSLAASVEEDVGATQRADRESGKGFNFAHRLFEDRWLKSSDVRFELTGIANRVDLSFRGGCGEIHFVYRLAYTSKLGNNTVDSRLPFTVNVLVPVADDGNRCASVAKQWLDVAAATDRVAALTRGPLAALAPASRVEINYQLVRWPSAVRPDMGGHAEYVLRAFSASGGNLTPIPLDDTPRTDLDAASKSELLAWIKENVAAIDTGNARVPEKFLALKTVSVAPRAASRLGNRPFSALFAEQDLAGIDLRGATTFNTAKSMLHKLDGITCNGCHQSRGIAGFHLLGEERSSTLRLNALQVGASPHLVDATIWRSAFVRATAEGHTPPARLSPDHASGALGGYGAHCSLGKDEGFSAFKCGAGLACKKVDDPILGHCLPAVSAPTHGDACQESAVDATLDATRDRVRSTVLACGDGATCMESKSGFPDGMCEKRCEELGKVSADGKMVCTNLPFGSGPLGGFNNCLFKLRRPFAECLADDARPTTARACDENNPCRDDYACVRVYTKGRNDGVAVGACVPPYFVFQGRVDGHAVGGL